EGVTGVRGNDRGMRNEHRQPFRGLSGQVLVRPHRDDAGDVEGAGDVDVEDVGMGVGAAHECGGDRRSRDIVDIPAVAGEQTWVFASGDLLTEEASGHGEAPSARSSAARHTAETMFW